VGTAKKEKKEKEMKTNTSTDRSWLRMIDNPLGRIKDPPPAPFVTFNIVNIGPLIIPFQVGLGYINQITPKNELISFVSVVAQGHPAINKTIRIMTFEIPLPKQLIDTQIEQLCSRKIESIQWDVNAIEMIPSFL
jgi:hypothetical protein